MKNQKQFSFILLTGLAIVAYYCTSRRLSFSQILLIAGKHQWIGMENSTDNQGM